MAGLGINPRHQGHLSRGPFCTKMLKTNYLVCRHEMCWSKLEEYCLQKSRKTDASPARVGKLSNSRHGEGDVLLFSTKMIRSEAYVRKISPTLLRHLLAWILNYATVSNSVHSNRRLQQSAYSLGTIMHSNQLLYTGAQEGGSM